MFIHCPAKINYKCNENEMSPISRETDLPNQATNAQQHKQMRLKISKMRDFPKLLQTMLTSPTDATLLRWHARKCNVSKLCIGK